MILIAVFYQLLLVIGFPILLDRLKMGDKVLDKLVLGTICIGHDKDGYLIFYNRH